jgi:hypothetical protein
MRKKLEATAAIILAATVASACTTSPPLASRAPGAAPSTSTTAPSTATSASEPSTALCRNPDRFTALSVTRTNPFPQNDIAFTFPDEVTSTDRVAVAAVASSACGLPVFPSGHFNCPADFGVGYALGFIVTDGRVVTTIDADPTGCPTVTGLGRPRSAASAFWARLAVALGLPAPREYCDPFRGRLPGAPTDCGPLIH